MDEGVELKKQLSLTFELRRVCEIRLFGKHKFEIKQQKYKVSDELKEGQARVLFGV